MSGRAVVCGDVRLTHRELADRTRRLGDALARQGLVPGDRVAVLAGNCHRYLELYLGLPAAGLVIVPINARHALPEIRYALQDAGVRVLFADRPVEGIDDLGVRVIAMGEEYEELLAAASPCRGRTTATRTTSPGSSTRAGRPARRRA